MRMSALTKGILGVAAVLSCLLASGTVIAAEDYIVRIDDKLKIKIFQFPELSGEYTVSTSGTVLIPPIGEVPVAGSSAIDISNQISKRFIGAGISNKPGATVEVLQSRPIYVLGDVQRPGEYTYRPGVTVLQAVTLAGGWFRLNDPGLMRLDREAITLTGDMRTLFRRYYNLVAERARLNAELAMKTDVVFPADLTRRAGEDRTLVEFLEDERLILNLNVGQLTKQLNSLNDSHGLYQKQLEAISRQILASKEQSQSVKKELDEVKGLFARGLTPITRQMGLERMLAQLEMAEQGYQTLMLRTQQELTQLDQRTFDLKSDRQAKLNLELRRNRLDLAEVAVKIDTDRNLMTEARVTVPSLTSSLSDMVEGRNLTIVRVLDGKAVTIDAEETSELYPGDVLKVKKSFLPSEIATDETAEPTLFMPTAGRN